LVQLQANQLTNYQSYYPSIVRDYNENERTIKAFITTSELNRNGQIVVPEGVSIENYLLNPVVLLNHNDSISVGQSVKVIKEKFGLVTEIRFAKTQLGQDLWTLYKDGDMRGLSMGYLVHNGYLHDEGYLVFTETEMLEQSCVTIPANPGCVVNALKKVKSEEIIMALEKNIEMEEVKNKIASFENSLNGLTDLNAKIDAINTLNEELKNKFTGIETDMNEIKNTLEQYKKRETEANISELIKNSIAKNLGKVA